MPEQDERDKKNFHEDTPRVLQSLSGTRVVRGVALNPGTHVSVIEPLLGELELILALAVNPGWGGQRFIPATEERIAQLRSLVEGERS